jgi:hypothetical protein
MTWFRYLARAEIFHFVTETGSGTDEYHRCSLSGDKAAIGHTLPSSAEGKKVWRYTSTTHPYIFTAWCNICTALTVYNHVSLNGQSKFDLDDSTLADSQISLDARLCSQLLPSDITCKKVWGTLNWTFRQQMPFVTIHFHILRCRGFKHRPIPHKVSV